MSEKTLGMEYKKKIPVIIIGLGNIGLQYDLSDQKTRNIFSHTKAFATHKGFDILFGVDNDQKQCKRFQDATGRPAFETLPESLDITGLMVIVIATPITARDDVFKCCLRFNPRLLVIEKPLAASMDEAWEIVNSCSSRNIGLFVNYIRRCEPSMIYIKEVVAENQLGELRSIHGYYTGGILNSCSHLIDLLIFWFGEPDRYSLLQPFDKTESGIDPELDMMIQFGNVNCILQALKKVDYSTVSLELVFQKGTVRILDFGRRVSITYKEPDPDFDNCIRLGHQQKMVPTDMYKYQQNVVDHLYRHLRKGEPLVSTGQTAMISLSICIDLMRQSEKR